VPNVTLKLGVNFSLSIINWFVVITLFIMALGRQENCSVAPAVGEPFSTGGRTGARQKIRIFFHYAIYFNNGPNILIVSLKLI